MGNEETIKELRLIKKLYAAYDSRCEAIDRAIAAVEQQERERWRSIEKEGNPDEDGEYLITWVSPKNGRRFIADVECEVYGDGTGTWILPDYMQAYQGVEIVAWRPVPDPYTEEESTSGQEEAKTQDSVQKSM